MSFRWTRSGKKPISKSVPAHDGDRKTLRKHSVLIEGHATSFSLEDAFFIQLKTIAGNRSSSLTSLIAEIDTARPQGQNLSSSIRVFVLEELQRELAEGPTTLLSGEQIL